jgi:hypothetical protein
MYSWKSSYIMQYILKTDEMATSFDTIVMKFKVLRTATMVNISVL